MDNSVQQKVFNVEGLKRCFKSPKSAIFFPGIPAVATNRTISNGNRIERKARKKKKLELVILKDLIDVLTFTLTNSPDSTLLQTLLLSQPAKCFQGWGRGEQLEVSGRDSTLWQRLFERKKNLAVCSDKCPTSNSLCCKSPPWINSMTRYIMCCPVNGRVHHLRPRKQHTLLALVICKAVTTVFSLLKKVYVAAISFATRHKRKPTLTMDVHVMRVL